MFSLFLLAVEFVDVDVAAGGGEAVKLLDDVVELLRVGASGGILTHLTDEAVDLALVGGEEACAGGELFEEGTDLADLRLGGVLVDLLAADHLDELSCLAVQLEEGGGVLLALAAQGIDLGEAEFLVAVGDDGVEFVVGRVEFVIEREELCDHLVRLRVVVGHIGLGGVVALQLCGERLEILQDGEQVICRCVDVGVDTCDFRVGTCRLKGGFQIFKIRQGDVLLVLSLAEAVEGRGDGKVKGDDVVVVVVRCLEVGIERRLARRCVACRGLL